MDIELAVDAMEMSEHVDEMVLFSGDGDFRSLVEAIQRRGVRVTEFRRSPRNRHGPQMSCDVKLTSFLT
jgi:uncharacterized LabA/DUF88 family protein